MITRFSVPNLHECTINLANIAANKVAPELVLTNAKVLSTYTDRIIDKKEIWISKGRVACIKDTGSAKKIFKKNNFLNTNYNLT